MHSWRHSRYCFVFILFAASLAYCIPEFRPCAELHSVTGGEYAFSITVNFNHIRAYRCVMDIPIAVVPVHGTRYGPLAAARCTNDGLGCIRLLRVVNVTVDSDIPTYKRVYKPELIMSQFDDIGQSVPFVTAPAQVSDIDDYANLPYADWVPKLINFEPRVRNPRGAVAVANMRTNFLVSTFTRQSPEELDADGSIFPGVVSSIATLLPSFKPFDISDFVYRGGRKYPGTALTVAGPRDPPLENTTQVSPMLIRALSPNFKNLNMGAAFMGIAMEKLIASGFNSTDAADILLASYLNSSAPIFFAEDVDPLIDGVPMSELDNATLDNSIFQETFMHIKIPDARTLACMSKEDWVAVLGSNISSWRPVGCRGSAQCSIAGITIDKRRILRRNIPYMFSSADPSCDTYRPQKPAVETAALKLGMAVDVGGTRVASIIRTVELSPKNEVHYIDIDGAGLAVITHPGSVKRLILEPSEQVHLLNCFSKRGDIANETTTSNPFINLPEYTTMNLIENQRGVLILSNANSDFHLGSGCGSMNPGMGIWRQVGNKLPTMQFQPEGGKVISGAGYNLSARLGINMVLGAFHQTGHSCAGGGSCATRTPCNLFSDEMKWLRGKGLLPPRFRPFNPAAPDLNTGLKQFINTTLESPSVPIVNVIPNIYKTVPESTAGCGGPGGYPLTLQAQLWNPSRMNAWIASNRIGDPRDMIMYVEDTNLRQYRRISHGVNFQAVAEVAWEKVPHEQIFNNTAEACVFMPITTYSASPELACVSASPKLAGTTAATIQFGETETYRELTLFVECLGFVPCPKWDASAVKLTDSVTGKPIPYTATVGAFFNRYSASSVERYVTERLGNVVGQYNASERFSQLPEYARYGVELTEHISIKFNQTAETAQYVWEVTGAPTVNQVLADEYASYYFAQLYQDGLAVAISPLHEFSCLSLTGCTLKKHIPALCKPPSFNTVPNATFGIVVNDTRCEGTFGCQSEWLYLIPAVVALIGIGYLIFYYEHMRTPKSVSSSKKDS